MTANNSLINALKKEGLRYTNQRQAVWDEIKSNEDHRDAEEIYGALRKKNLKRFKSYSLPNNRCTG